VQRRFQGRLDTPLSPLGRRQAERVALRLARPHDPPALPVPAGLPAVIVHSPLARAAGTASAIGAAIVQAGHAEVQLQSDDRFAEIGQGDWEGRLASEIAEVDGDRLAAWRQRPAEASAPGGEALADVRTRVTDGLTDLLAGLAAGREPGSILGAQVAGYGRDTSDQPWAVLVAHDGVFKVTLLTLFDLPLERFWMWSSDLCAISILELRAGRPVVLALNLTEHLAGLAEEVAQAESEERQRSGAL